MSTEENKRLVQRYVAEVANRHELAVIEELIAATYTHHGDNGKTQEVRGPICVQQNVAATTAAFPDANWAIDDMIAEGDKVVYRWTATGTHQGKFLGVAATGKPIKITGVTIFRIENGKIAERWGSADLLGLLQQTGGITE